MRLPSPLEIVGLLWVIAIALAALVGLARAEPAGSLYAFCDSDWPEICDQKALMLKDVCEETVREWTDGSDRFSCAVVDDATRDAYLSTLEPRIREKTLRAWRDGR